MEATLTPTTCAECGREKKLISRGLCSACYSRLNRMGNLRIQTKYDRLAEHPEWAAAKIQRICAVAPWTPADAIAEQVGVSVSYVYRQIKKYQIHWEGEVYEMGGEPILTARWRTIRPMETEGA